MELRIVSDFVAIIIPIIFFIALLLQAVLRALYAYFADRPLKEIPHIEVIRSVDSFLFLFFMVDYVLEFLLHGPSISSSDKLGQEEG